MIYSTSNIHYLIYNKAYLLNRVINRALYRVIMLPPYSPGVPPVVPPSPTITWSLLPIPKYEVDWHEARPKIHPADVSSILHWG